MVAAYSGFREMLVVAYDKGFSTNDLALFNQL